MFSGLAYTKRYQKVNNQFSGAFSGKCKIKNHITHYHMFSFISPPIVTIYIPFPGLSVEILTPFFLTFRVFDTLNAIRA